MLLLSFDVRFANQTDASHVIRSITCAINHINTNTTIGPGGAEFAEFQKKTEEEHGVQFHTSVGAVPPVADGVKRLALISGRTVDNPRLLTEAIAAGCTVVYLEKPGAPTVAELEAMKADNSQHPEDQPFRHKDFIALIEKHDQHHNAVLTNLRNGL